MQVDGEDADLVRVQTSLGVVGVAIQRWIPKYHFRMVVSIFLQRWWNEENEIA